MSDRQKRDEEAHVVSAKKVAGSGYQQGYHAGLTAAARTSKAILEERDALRVRADKAEAEVERLRAALSAIYECRDAVSNLHRDIARRALKGKP